MNQVLVDDYSFARPTPAQLKAAGIVGVVRYLSYDASKNLSVAEAKALRAAGLWISLVWETGANRAGQGGAAGKQDALAANKQADALGYPKTAVLWFAVDYAATPDQVRAYFAAAVAASPRPVGLYGSYALTTARLVKFNWQTAAWSGGKLDAGAHLYQRVTETRPVPGTDENVLMHAFPAWGTSSPQPAAKTAPAPSPAPVAMTRGHNVDPLIPGLRKAIAANAAHPIKRGKLRAALAALLSIVPRKK